MTDTLNDYSSTREVIERVKIYQSGKIKRDIILKAHSLYILVPYNIRRRLKMGQINESDFKVIICRK